MSTLSSMRQVDAYLSGRAKGFDGSSIVYKEPDGSFTLERDGVGAISLGSPFPIAKNAIDMMRRTIGASNVSREPEPRFPIAPALTPREWTEIRNGTSAAVFELPNFMYDPIEPEDVRSSIAKLNFLLSDGDPRKITHERLKNMRDRMEQLALEGYDVDELSRFADALASYLPPRDGNA